MRIVLGILLIAGSCEYAQAEARDVALTPEGFRIPIGEGDPYILNYPFLLNANDSGLKAQNITVAPDGKSVSMTYAPSGRCTIERKSETEWAFHITEIPVDRVKFGFGMKLPLSLAQEVACVQPNDKPLIVLPEAPEKDKITLYNGNPKWVKLTRPSGGVVFQYPRTTWTMLRDHRPWGQKYFRLDHILYFPGKKNVPEINYTLIIADPASVTESTSAMPSAVKK